VRAVAVVVLVPAAVAVVVFANTLGNGLVYDDPIVIERSLALAEAPLRGALAAPRALTLLTIHLDRVLWGGTPWALHATNALLNALAASLATVLALVLSGSLRVALWAGLLFAVHPVHVEAVASIENRKDLLAMVFVAGSAVLYRARDRGWPPYLGALVCFALAMHAKEVAAAGLVGMLPLIDLLAERDGGDPWPRRAGRAAVRALPVLVLGAALIVWYSAQVPEYGPARAARAGDTLLDYFRPEAIARETESQVGSYPEALAGTAVSVLEVGRLLVFPLRLSADHPLQAREPARVAAGIVVLAGWIGLAALAARPAPAVAVAMLWTVVMYLPSSKVVPVAHFFVAERYLYVPSFGLCLLLALGLDGLQRLAERRHSRAWTALAAGAAASLVVLGAARSAIRNRDWRDELSLWSSSLRAVPRGTRRIHEGLGTALLAAGRTEEALGHLREAVRLQPGYVFLRVKLGTALLGAGRPAEALEHLQAAVRGQPTNGLARYMLALALIELRRFDEAAAHLGTVAAALGAGGGLDELTAADLERSDVSADEFAAGVRKWLAVARVRAQGP
jgi:tetratricopeptide (TPR) repeat protein